MATAAASSSSPKKASTVWSITPIAITFAATTVTRGKATDATARPLLSRLSAARPEIANYPFTTKYPNLGQVRLDLDRSFIMADIPGLIEGAAVGVGLGHDFLKHIERAGVLVHLVEPMPMDQSDPVANYHAIRNELIQFNPALGKRPEMIVVSKSELPGAQEVAAQLKSDTGQEVHIISAATGAGLPPLLNAIDKMLTAHRNAAELAAAESDTSDAS